MTTRKKKKKKKKKKASKQTDIAFSYLLFHANIIS
jgi:hypothetical protein